MSMDKLAVIILAAGKGTRMKSDLAKVLHPVAGVPMVRYVVETALRLGGGEVVVVVGHQAEAVQRVLAPYRTLRFAVQTPQLGTGHAVLTGLEKVSANSRDVVILCGDTPLIRTETLVALVERHRNASSPLTLLGARMKDPTGYGRIFVNTDGQVVRIVEESDASGPQKRISLVNTGTYCIAVRLLKKWLSGLRDSNAQKEFYLTDVVAAAYRDQMPAILVESPDCVEVLGVNTVEDLVEAERLVLSGRSVSR